MRDLLIVFFIISFLFLIIIFPFKTRLMGYCNFMDLKCYYSLKTWIIKLICGRIEFINGKVEIKNEESLLTKTYKNEYMKLIGKEVVSELSIKKLEVFFTGGFKNDSFSSAIMCGMVLSFVETVFAYLTLKYDGVKIYKDIDPTFDENNLELTLDIVVSISLWRLVCCLFNAGNKAKKMKELRNEKQGI